MYVTFASRLQSLDWTKKLCPVRDISTGRLQSNCCAFVVCLHLVRSCILRNIHLKSKPSSWAARAHAFHKHKASAPDSVVLTIAVRKPTM